jgi:hypothetical protein
LSTGIGGGGGVQGLRSCPRARRRVDGELDWSIAETGRISRAAAAASRRPVEAKLR